MAQSQGHPSFLGPLHPCRQRERWKSRLARTGSWLLEAPTLDKRPVGGLRSLSLDLLLTCPPGAGWTGPCSGKETGSAVPTLQGHETLGSLRHPAPLEVGTLVTLPGPSHGTAEVTAPLPCPPFQCKEPVPAQAGQQRCTVTQRHILKPSSHLRVSENMNSASPTQCAPRRGSVQPSREPL